jgi:hypothetical protein
MMDQAFAEPVWPTGTGFQLQRSAPVRASNARTTPEGEMARWLSATVDPTMTRPLTIAGGDVTEYSPLASPTLSTS